MTAWAAEPTLSQPDIDDLLDQYAMPDAAGKVKGDLGWVETYNLRAAAREGWKWKAAKASELLSTDLDGDRMSANQLFEHCQRMIKEYAGAASPEIGGSGYGT